MSLLTLYWHYSWTQLALEAHELLFQFIQQSFGVRHDEWMSAFATGILNASVCDICWVLFYAD